MLINTFALLSAAASPATVGEWISQYGKMLTEGIWGTIYMTIVSTFIGYLFGLPMGVLLTVTRKDGLKPNAGIYKVLDVIANIVRSIPFLILLILLIPFTRALVGKSYGTTAVIVPLSIAAIPFIARMVESSLTEVDAGVIEAARSMGASNMQIIMRVLLVEGRTSLIVNATIAMGTILGYSAMAGTVGGGGLGDIAVRYGYNRYIYDVMFVTVILLIILFQVFQTYGMFFANHFDRRKSVPMKAGSLIAFTAFSVLLGGAGGVAIVQFVKTMILR